MLFFDQKKESRNPQNVQRLVGLPEHLLRCLERQKQEIHGSQYPKEVVKAVYLTVLYSELQAANNRAAKPTEIRSLIRFIGIKETAY